MQSSRFILLLSAFLTLSLGLQAQVIRSQEYFEKAVDKYNTHSYRQSAAMLEKALKYDANNADAWFLLSQIRYNDGNKEKALECVNQAIKARPRFYQALQFRATLFIDKKEYSKALSDLDSCLIEYPDNAVALGKRGYIKYLIKDYSGAYADLNQSIHLDAESYSVFNNRGLVRIERKEYQAAIDDFNKSLKLNPHFSYVINNRGYAKILMSKLDDGHKDIEESLSVEPDNAWALRNLGIYYFLKGEYQIGLDNLTQAHGIDPTVPLLHYYMAQCYFGLKQNTQGCEELEKSLLEKETEAESLKEKCK